MKYFVVFVLTIFPSLAFACGTTVEQFEAYYDREGVIQKEAWLMNLDCTGPTNYKPRDADPVIISVLSDAIEDGIGRPTIESVIQRYHCMYGERGSQDYAPIRSYIGEERYKRLCSAEEMAKLFIVNAEPNAILRSGPSQENEKIFNLTKGSMVKVSAVINGWAEVITAGGEHHGYVYFPLLSPY